MYFAPIFMVHTEVLFEGKVKLEDIIVSSNHFNRQVEYDIDLDENSIKTIWNKFKKKYPESYNGSLVTLETFDVDEKFLCGCELLTLYIGSINYSSFIAMREKNITFNNSYGVIGTQCLIFSPDENYILVGRRKNQQYYSPGLLTVPGGFVEPKDLESGSLMREVYEEVNISFKNEKISTILTEHNNYSAIMLLTAELNQEFNKGDIFEGKDNEWENNNLFWLSIDELKNMSDSELMEGLTYLKNKN